MLRYTYEVTLKHIVGQGVTKVVVALATSMIAKSTAKVCVQHCEPLVDKLAEAIVKAANKETSDTEVVEEDFKEVETTEEKTEE